MTIWYVGKTMRLSGVLTDEDGAKVDPSAGVVVELRSPSGVVSEQAATKSAIGEYYCDVTFTEHGRWQWRMYTEGTYITAEQGYVDVNRINTSGD